MMKAGIVVLCLVAIVSCGSECERCAKITLKPKIGGAEIDFTQKILKTKIPSKTKWATCGTAKKVTPKQGDNDKCLMMTATYVGVMGEFSMVFKTRASEYNVKNNKESRDMIESRICGAIARKTGKEIRSDCLDDINIIECEKGCGFDYDPVCGSDGEKYDNRCLFDIAQCKNVDLKVDEEGSCSGEEAAEKK